jgi:hypothetical protein
MRLNDVRAHMRLLVGAVFLSEGVQNLYPEELAAGRFAGIGIPAPEFFGPFVGGRRLIILSSGPRPCSESLSAAVR